MVNGLDPVIHKQSVQSDGRTVGTGFRVWHYEKRDRGLDSSVVTRDGIGGKRNPRNDDTQLLCIVRGWGSPAFTSSAFAQG